MSQASGTPAGPSSGLGWSSLAPGPQSLVLVSRLPFVRLFQALLSLVAPEYFDKLTPCLEAGEWPSGAGTAASSSWLWVPGTSAGSLHRGRLLTLATCVDSVQ